MAWAPQEGPSGDPGLRHGALASCSLVVGQAASVVLAAVFLRVLLRRGHAAAAFVERAAVSRLVLLTTAGEGQDHMTRRRTVDDAGESRLRLYTRARS